MPAGFEGNNYLGYNRMRLSVIVFMMAANVAGTVISLVDRHYPIGVGPLLILIPCLLRELDLRRGRPLRKFGRFEWSCFIGGFLFLAVLPFVIV
jgi:hypothetical protein